MFHALMFVRAFLAERVRLDDRGVTSVEYGLLVVLIALVMAIGATLLGTQLQALFTSVASQL